jgi:hypothetical protein
MTAAVGARNLFKVDTGVVHALLQARYYDGSKGEFLAVGNRDQVRQLSQQDQQQFLTDPQQMNSYSYASDNPISKSDPSGGGPELIPLILGAVELYGWAMNGIDTYNAYNADIAYRSVSSSNDKAQTSTQFAYDGLQGAIASAFTKAGWKRVSPMLGVLQAGQDTITSGPDVANYYGNGGLQNNVKEVWNFMSNKLQVASSLSTVRNNASSYLARVSAANTYNTASGASSNQSKLWVTPSGAVVTWNGGVVSAPSKTK